MTKKILYIMGLDWKFVKQRPHFIAEELSNFYDIKVIYFYSIQFLFRNSENITRNDKKLNIKPAFRLPFYQNDLIYELNRIYMKVYFMVLIKRFKPDLIWITFPLQIDYIPTNTSSKIIYDCSRDLRSHGFYRFFAFELLSALILLNVPIWFRDPLSARQLASCFLGVVSIGLAIEGFRLLRLIGKPTSAAARQHQSPF